MSRAKKREFVKVIVLGDSGVGKTSLLECYVNKTFTDEYKPTEVADFYSKQDSLEGISFDMQMWGKAGTEKYQATECKSFFLGADCCMMVFDVTKADTFKALDSWRHVFFTHAETWENFPVVVIGNKVDLTYRVVVKGSEREVSTREAQDWCRGNGNILYFETSAKSDINVEQAFQAVAKSVVTLRREKLKLRKEMDNQIKLTNGQDQDNRSYSVCQI